MADVLRTYAHDQEREQRIRRSKLLQERLKIGLQVVEDLPFWVRRIRRAIKRGDNFTDNAWSLRGVESKTYVEALESCLVTLLKVRVVVSFETLGDEDCVITYIKVRWSED